MVTRHESATACCYECRLKVLFSGLFLERASQVPNRVIPNIALCGQLAIKHTLIDAVTFRAPPAAP